MQNISLIVIQGVLLIFILIARLINQRSFIFAKRNARFFWYVYSLSIILYTYLIWKMSLRTK